jgi:hypothetical protein
VDPPHDLAALLGREGVHVKKISLPSRRDIPCRLLQARGARLIAFAQGQLDHQRCDFAGSL